MKTIIIALLFLGFGIIAKGQTKAITEIGEEVILYEDGTWTYVDNNISFPDEIELNKKEFKRNEKSTFLVKSQKMNIGIYINPKSWSFEKGAKDDDSEFIFQMRGEDLYAMLISEKIEIPLITLKDIAIENAKLVAPDVKVIEEEYRLVNDIQVLMMQMSGTIQGMKFIYYGYYFSNENGTIQFLTYTAKNLFDEYSSDMEEMLNGLVEL